MFCCGDEWLSSLPLHIQLFQVMGWTPPKYGHIAPIQKLEDEARRKLSKRKDPEANIAFYGEKGYPKEVVIDYLMNLANSDFEDFKRANPEKSYRDFEFKIERLNNSGPLLDFVKLENISKDLLQRSAPMSFMRVCTTGPASMMLSCRSEWMNKALILSRF